MTQGILGAGLNAIVRIPVIGAGVAATGLALEGAYRVFITAFKVIGFNGENNWTKQINSRVPDVAVNVFRPFGGDRLSNRQVAVSALVCAVVAALGWEIANQLCGPAPDIYNRFGSYVSPVQIKTDWRNPVIEYLLRLVNPPRNPETTNETN